MRRVVAAAGIYGALTAALLYPLWPRFGSAFPGDASDAVLNAWILHHGWRAVPLTAAWWNGPMFFPAASVLALSESLLALLPVSTLVEALTHNPVAAYNTVFALAFPLCGLAACALGREVAGRSDSALVGGLAFMLGTYRGGELNHLQVLSFYWSPLVLLGLHGYVRERRWRWLVLFAGSWVAQSLANGYAMFQISILVVLWLIWFARSIRVVASVFTAWACGGLVMAPVLLRYEQVHQVLHLSRTVDEMRGLALDLAGFGAAPPALSLWGRIIASYRPETAAFPGVTLIAIAAVALAIARRQPAPAPPGTGSSSRDTGSPSRDTGSPSRWQRSFTRASAVFALLAFAVYWRGALTLGPLRFGDARVLLTAAVLTRVLAFLGGAWTRRMWRDRSPAAFYLLAMAAMYVLALGPEPRLLGRPIFAMAPYAWLLHLPGFDALRVPARFVMPAALCQSVLVSLALAQWTHSRPDARRLTVLALVAAGLVADGWFHLPVVTPPDGGVRRWPSTLAAVAELPVGDTNADHAALYRSLLHGRPTVNGASGFRPPHYLALAEALAQRRYSALFELTAHGPIGVATDGTLPDAAETRRLLLAAGLRPGPEDNGWQTFTVPMRAPRPIATGPPVPVRTVSATVQPERAQLMVDDDPRTAWDTVIGQAGGEQVTADLGSTREVGAVELEMSAWPGDFPRALEIDVSEDGADWQPAWGGEPVVLALHGALADPGRAPITFDLGRVRGRFLRLTQTGAAPGVPWSIATLRVRAPAPGR